MGVVSMSDERQQAGFELMRAGGSCFTAWPGVVGAHLRGERADVVAYWFEPGHEAPEDRVSRDVVSGYWVGTQGMRVTYTCETMESALMEAGIRWRRESVMLEARREAADVALARYRRNQPRNSREG